ncbi:MAG: CBS domain-containing protein [Desulfobacterales bacterium]|nr:CBS domain-containing protein [Desulfobacterales bacterium]
MLQVKDIMTRKVFVLEENQSLAIVRSLMKIKHIRHVPIVDEHNQFIGLLTHRDLLAYTISLLADADQSEQDAIDHHILIKDVMKTDVMTISPDETVYSVINILLKNKYGCVPVLENGELVGIVTEADFLKLTISLLNKIESLSSTLS